MNASIQKRMIFMVLALLLPFVAASCGGGSGTTVGGGVGGTGVGPITGFGSVKLNGIEYDTSTADIVIGGAHGRPEAQLKVGMRARVRGTFSDATGKGVATLIEVLREVRGPMDDNGVDLVNNRVKVAGQTVLVDPSTIFDGVADLVELKSVFQPSNSVHPEIEAQGGVDGNGFIHATFLRKGLDDFALSDNTEIRGKIADLNPTAGTFRVGTLTIGFASLPPSGRINWPITGIDNGLFVEVKGTLTAAGGSGTLNALSIEVLESSIGDPEDLVKIEGYVVSGTSASFVIGGANGNDNVIGSGVTPTGGVFAVGAKVQVEGKVTGKAVTASRITVRSTNNVKMEAGPTIVDKVGRTLTLLGKVVTVDGFTRFKDDTSSSNVPFGLDDITTDNTIRVVGSFDNGTNQVKAVLIELIGAAKASPELVTLAGPVGSKSIALSGEVTLNIIGITVQSDLFTAFVDIGDIPFPDPANLNFFAAVKVPPDPNPSVVEVKRGIFNAGTITAPFFPDLLELEVVPSLL